MPSLKSLSRTKPSIKPCLARTSACLGVLATAGLAAHAQTSDSDKIDSLEKQNEALQLRLDTLENVVKQEGLMPSDTNVVTKSVISALGQVNISGFVQGLTGSQGGGSGGGAGASKSGSSSGGTGH